LLRRKKKRNGSKEKKKLRTRELSGAKSPPNPRAYISGVYTSKICNNLKPFRVSAAAEGGKRTQN